MNKQDLSYIVQALSSFKSCIIHGAERTGLLSQRFQIRYDDIKSATSRVRLSPVIIEGYINYLNQQGMNAESDGMSAIFVEIDLNHTPLTPQEAQILANSLEAFNFKQAREYEG
jgi:hypothetical protein